MKLVSGSISYCSNSSKIVAQTDHTLFYEISSEEWIPMYGVAVVKNKEIYGSVASCNQ